MSMEIEGNTLGKYNQRAGRNNETFKKFCITVFAGCMILGAGFFVSKLNQSPDINDYGLTWSSKHDLSGEKMNIFINNDDDQPHKYKLSGKIASSSGPFRSGQQALINIAILYESDPSMRVKAKLCLKEVDEFKSDDCLATATMTVSDPREKLRNQDILTFVKKFPILLMATNPDVTNELPSAVSK